MVGSDSGSSRNGAVIMQRFAYANTTTGVLRGAIENGICTFKGVPYGATTVGSARFMAPRKPIPWAGIRDALQFGPACPQLNPTLTNNDGEVAKLLRGSFE